MSARTRWYGLNLAMRATTNWNGDRSTRSAGAGIMRGDVWLAGLDPTIGSGIQKRDLASSYRHADMHDFLRTVIVAPMTTRGRVAPYRIPVTFAGRSGLILLDQFGPLQGKTDPPLEQHQQGYARDDARQIARTLRRIGSAHFR